MAVPALDIRCNLDGVGLNRISNDGFDVNNTGWSASAGIQGAATSINRDTSSPYYGAGCGRLVTTSTSGSGCKYVMSSTFTSGVTYRFRVYLRSISGGTSAGIRIGSLGTAGDRAVSTFTVTSTWTAYSVDFTPTGNRTDIQVNVYTNSAAIMTCDVDMAEVYATNDDLTDDADTINWTHGANFEGGLSAGSCTLTLHNESTTFSDGARKVTTGMPLYIRATYAGVMYGLWYGIVKRATAQAEGRTVTVFATDVVDSWQRSAQQDSGYNTDSVATNRATILTALGVVSTQQNLSLFEAEADIPIVGYDLAGPLDVLASLDRSTGTLSFLRFDPSTSVLYVYTTLARNQRSARASSETVSTNMRAITSEINEDVNISDQRVTYASKDVGSQDLTLWTYGDIPPFPDQPEIPWGGLSLDAGQTISGRADIAQATNVVLAYTYLGSAPSTTSSIGTQNVDWTLTAGGGGTQLTSLYITGRPLILFDDSVFQQGTTTLGWHVLAPDINGDFIVSNAAAAGLAQWITEHTTGLVPRYDVTIEGLFPTQVVRQVGDLITLSTPVIAAASVDVVVRSLDTTVDMSGAQWSTHWLLDVAGNPTLTGGFILDTSQLNGTDVLGY